MTAKQEEGMLDRLRGMMPEGIQREVTRLTKRVRDRLPPVVIEHRIDVLERRMNRRLKEIEGKLDDLLHRIGRDRAA